MQTIAEFLHKKLWAYNQDHPGITKVASNAEESIVRVRRAIEKHNSYQNNELGFQGIDLTPEELSEMKIAMPDAFRKPAAYEATATKNHYFGDGELAGQTSFAIEVKF